MFAYGGVCPGWVSVQEGCLPRRVSVQGGVCLRGVCPEGVSAQGGGCLPGGRVCPRIPAFNRVDTLL